MSDADDGWIRIRGARVHNLRDIDVDIPHNSCVVITGVSGSGKSSLAFDTLFAEGQRRYLESLSTYTRQFLNQLQRPDVDLIQGLPPTISVDQRMGAVHRRSTLATTTEIHDYLRLLYARVGQPHCPECGEAVSQQTPREIVDQILDLPPRRRVMLLARLVSGRKGKHRGVFERICKDGFVRARVDGAMVDAASPPELSQTHPHDIDVVVDRVVIKDGLRGRIQESVDLALKHGDGTCLISVEIDGVWQDQLFSSKFACVSCHTSLPNLEPRHFSFNSPQGACSQCSGLGYLVDGDPADPDRVCADCQGSRLGPLARTVTIAGVAIPELAAKTVDQAHRFIADLEVILRSRAHGFSAQQVLAAQGLLPDIASRLEFLCRVGLDYLTLDRATRSLSGGEFQRARLASCLGSGLTGVCYVLDEPTVGLHPRDTARMIAVLHDLRDQDNTVVVVEHDDEMIRLADFVIDLGPGAGHAGGQVVASGSPQEIAAQADSLTGKYLSDPGSFALADTTRKIDWKQSLTLTGARLHNLQHLSVQIPLRVMSVVTGVSGSGKTSLIAQTLAPAVRNALAIPIHTADTFERLLGVEQIDRVVEIDQSPIGRTGRSNPATYSGVWNEVRKLFARTRDARLRGYRVGRFSFNSKSGRCPQCDGFGLQRIQMHFLPEMNVECPGCRGARFNPQTLQVRFRGKSVGDILKMQIDEAADFFQNFSKPHAVLKTFSDVGLGYLQLGQSSLTLSGGEAQRVKLASELSQAGSTKTLFVLDEPTTGLHAADVQKLIDLLHRLVSRGNTVLVIEHHLEIMASAHWIIDMGPEGGAAGGQIVATDTAHQLAVRHETHTGRALHQFFQRR